MLNYEDNSGFNYAFIFCLVYISLTFIILLLDYFGTFSLKNTIDTEFKSIVVSELSKNITDEYSSDYLVNFDNTDEETLKSNIKEIFVNNMKTNKNINIQVINLEINKPSSSTITCKFTGTYEYIPIIGEKKFTFFMPVESRAKIIRLDEL